MSKVELFRVRRCKECDHVEKMLEELGVSFSEFDVSLDPYREEVVKCTGCFSVPQLLINGSYVGNYETVKELYRANKLKEALAA